jgi:hypothetical protein
MVSDDTIHVCGFNGEGYDVLELHTASQIDAVLLYVWLVRMIKTMVLLLLGVNLTAFLSV